MKNAVSILCRASSWRPVDFESPLITTRTGQPSLTWHIWCALSSQYDGRRFESRFQNLMKNKKWSNEKIQTGIIWKEEMSRFLFQDSFSAKNNSDHLSLMNALGNGNAWSHFGENMIWWITKVIIALVTNKTEKVIDDTATCC